MMQDKMESLHGGNEPGCRLQDRCISNMSSSSFVTMEYREHEPAVFKRAWAAWQQMETTGKLQIVNSFTQ